VRESLRCPKILDIGLLIILTEKAHLYPVLAVAINQIFIIAYSFLLNKYWSFSTKQKPIQQFGRYIILVAFNYFTSILLMYLFYGMLDINYTIVRVFSIGLLFMFNFAAYKYWVYKEL
jgi:putative flippase GtrA